MPLLIGKEFKMKKILIASFLAVGLSAIGSAATYSWVDWDTPSSGSVTGSFATDEGTVGVTLTGPFTSITSNFPSWTPTATWADGTIIDNAPDNGTMVRIDGTGTFTLAFDRAVSDLAMSFWSVGRTNTPVSYTFDETPSFVVGGASAEFGGSAITVSGNTVEGREGNGSVLFADTGTISSLTFTVSPAEVYHGINLGLQYDQPVPEPTTMVLASAGALALLRRRRKANA